MTKLKIAILGTRGIPNHYGGFEQLAESLSAGLVEKGHDVTVYSSHSHPYQEKKLNGVDIVHRFDPEKWMGSAGQFLYDLNCIRHARKNKFDVLLFLGYTSSSIWGKLYPKNTTIISNMDGLEWKRSKYSAKVKKFLLTAEKLAVKYSHHLIADSPVILSYLQNKYQSPVTYIPYGAAIIDTEDESTFASHDLCREHYYMLMARMEPENNIEMILDGFHASTSEKKFIVVGNIENKFGASMYKKFANDSRITFAGGIYTATTLHTLKKNSALYFHGHTVGGTNPSLLEAMASEALIAAHDNEFNRVSLQNDGLYFTSSEEITALIEASEKNTLTNQMITNNLSKIKDQYNWPSIIDQYEQFISDCYECRAL